MICTLRQVRRFESKRGLSLLSRRSGLEQEHCVLEVCTCTGVCQVYSTRIPSLPTCWDDVTRTYRDGSNNRSVQQDAAKLPAGSRSPGPPDRVALLTKILHLCGAFEHL